jgi:iron(III) transport system substrate-binding protein
MHRAGLGLLMLPALLCGLSCKQQNTPDELTVVVYCSVDDVLARQILGEFTVSTGIRVQAKYDTEAGKTTGLLSLLLAERDRPRADVFWSSELFGTIRLAEEGLLATYDPPPAADIPQRFRDAAQRWTAFGARGRVLAFNPVKVAKEQAPQGWAELTDPRWKGQVALANPLFGTTRGHVAAMFALWGDEQATAFLQALADNDVRIADGNAAAVRMLARGEVLLAATDTDDVWAARGRGESIDLVYPDMGDGGTLWIPNSVAIIADGPNPESARRLVDFLCSRRIERMLAESLSGNLPVRPALAAELNMSAGGQSSIDYVAIAEALPRADAAAREILLR